MSVTIQKVTRLFRDDVATQDSNGIVEPALFLVEVAEKNCSPAEVVTAIDPRIPRYKQLHPYITNCAVSKKTAKRAPVSGTDAPGAMFAWHVVVEYARIQIGGRTANSRNIQINVTGAKTGSLTQCARGPKGDGSDDVPIRNAVGDLYPDPQEIFLYDEIIEISFETATLDMDAIAEARGKINKMPITMNLPQGANGALPFQRTFDSKNILLEFCDYSSIITRVGDPGATDEEDELSLWGVRLVLINRPGGWEVRPPQKGYRWRVPGTSGTGSNKKLTEYVDHAEYLDVNGYKLADGAKLVALSPVQLHYSDNIAAIIADI